MIDSSASGRGEARMVRRWLGGHGPPAAAEYLACPIKCGQVSPSISLGAISPPFDARTTPIFSNLKFSSPEAMAPFDPFSSPSRETTQ
jgi:hypothetical protein